MLTLAFLSQVDDLGGVFLTDLSLSLLCTIFLTYVRRHLLHSNVYVKQEGLACLHCTTVCMNMIRPLRSPLAQMEEERREHVAKMKKMEQEMEQVFEMKVKEKLQKLRDSEAEVNSPGFLFKIQYVYLFALHLTI